MSKRIKAFLIHLGCSFILAILTLILVFYVWYPSPLHSATGVSHIFLIMLAVDVIMGPMLTLLVYKVGKKSLVFDLTLILLLQLGIFSYGLHTVAVGRPAWIVFNTDRFDLVQAIDIDIRRLNQAKPEYRQPSWFNPRWISSHQPNNSQDRTQLLFESAKGGYDIAQRPELYTPLKSDWIQIRTKAQPISVLNNYNDSKKVTVLTSKWKNADSWVPLRGRAQDMTVLLNKEKGEVVSIVDLRPWH